MARRGERPDLSPAQHYSFLKNSRIGGGKGTLNAQGLTWEYKERPTPLSREYTLCIEYMRGEHPRVFVKDPDISALAGDRAKDLPHVYRNPLRLCLFLPKAGEWNGTMRIDRTFVPWASVWLFYFEEWLASNDWKGEGVHPDGEDTNQTRRERRALKRGERDGFASVETLNAGTESSEFKR